MTAAPQPWSAADWDTVEAFAGRCATREDTEEGRAVFALAETVGAAALEWMLPQPVIWYPDEADMADALPGFEPDPVAALVVQAEAHGLEGGGRMEVLGLLLPDGAVAIAFSEEVEEVDGQDPVWLALLGELPPAGDDGEA